MTENKKTIEQLKKELREAEEDLERAELERKIRETRMKAAETRGFGGFHTAFCLASWVALRGLVSARSVTTPSRTR